ncbi:MAG: glycosyltransferase family 9 protein [Bdellovibrionales bacterium]
MKILVLSLLRLGDFIQIVPILEGLSARYPQAQIDVFTHSPAKALQPMLHGVRRWWTLDREELQQGLGRADVPLLTSFDVLREHLDSMNSANYDLVINLTQTRFSGWIMGYLEGRDKLGLTFSPGGQARFHSPWFRYLDQHAAASSADVFHYTDIFHLACGLKEIPRSWKFSVTARGETEVTALNLGSGERVACQVFTSDTKKTWGEDQWTELLTGLRAERPEAEIYLLGAANEEERLSRIQVRVPGVRKAILSLEGVLSLLHRTDLLITGDTSIKHLANATDTKVLELSLGPSDWRRTGIYRADNLILQSREECAPCAHSSPCSQASHLCSARISAVTVKDFAVAFLNSDWEGLRSLAEKHRSALQALRTRHTNMGFWFAYDLNGGECALERILERCAWKFILSGDLKRPLVELGSESVHLAEEVTRLFGNTAPIMPHLDFLEKELHAQEEKARCGLQSFTRQPLGFVGGAPDLGRLRQMQASLEEQHRKLEIKSKLVRSLKSRLTEYI